MKRNKSFKTIRGGGNAEKVNVPSDNGSVFEGLRDEAIIGLCIKELQIYDIESIQESKGKQPVGKSKEDRTRRIEHDPKRLQEQSELHTAIQDILKLCRKSDNEKDEVQVPRTSSKLADDTTTGDSKSELLDTLRKDDILFGGRDGPETLRTEKNVSPRHISGKEQTESKRKVQQDADNSVAPVLPGDVHELDRPSRPDDSKSVEIQFDNQRTDRIIDMAEIREAWSVHFEERLRQHTENDRKKSRIQDKPPLSQKELCEKCLGIVRGRDTLETIETSGTQGHENNLRLHRSRSRPHPTDDERVRRADESEDNPDEIESLNRIGPIKILDNSKRYEKGINTYFVFQDDNVNSELRNFKKEVLVK